MGDKPITTAHVNRLYFDTARMNLTNYKNALMPNAKDGLEYHRSDVLMATIPAANGVSSANALARIYAMHANDGIWQGRTVISKDVVSRMRAIQTDGFDAVMPANMRWRMGFHRLFSLQDVPDGYGHMGYNGSVAFFVSQAVAYLLHLFIILIPPCSMMCDNLRYLRWRYSIFKKIIFWRDECACMCIARFV